VRHALELGYRHIDTAYLYRNESIIGKVLGQFVGDGKIKREQVFLVTKVYISNHVPEYINRPEIVIPLAVGHISRTQEGEIRLRTAIKATRRGLYRFISDALTCGSALCIR